MFKNEWHSSKLQGTNEFNEAGDWWKVESSEIANDCTAKAKWIPLPLGGYHVSPLAQKLWNPADAYLVYGRMIRVSFGSSAGKREDSFPNAWPDQHKMLREELPTIPQT